MADQQNRGGKKGTRAGTATEQRQGVRDDQRTGQRKDGGQPNGAGQTRPAAADQETRPDEEDE